MPRSLSFRSIVIGLTALSLAPLTPDRAAAQGWNAAAPGPVLDSIARSALHEGNLAGLSVAVVRGADTLLLEAYGSADLELGVATPPDAVYEIASVTKQFTAAAVLQLVDQGLVDLDASIDRYLSGLPADWPTITVRQLLDNTSGIHEPLSLPGYEEMKTQAFPRDSLLDIIFAAPRTFEPGEAAWYNSSGFILAGHLIEAVSGLSYEEYVESRIFQALGMERSRYCSDLELIPDRTRGFHAAQAGMRPAIYTDHTWPWAAGSLCATAGDLVRWLQALHGGAVLSEAGHAAMTTPARLTNGVPIRYGLGVEVAEDRSGNRYIGHDGSGPGFAADARFYPEDKLAVVALANTSGSRLPMRRVTEALAAAVLGKAPTPDVPQAPGPDELQGLTGLYAGESPDEELSIRVERRGAQLWAAPSGDDPVALTYLGDGVFGRGTWRLRFAEDASGKARLYVSPIPSDVYLLTRR